MIQRIELVNFMSHQRTVIEPAAGLTVLIGQNNVGKSALVAALQILAANDPSTFVMRHDEKSCSVTIETDDGHTIVWSRKTSPSYTIDGQRFDRLKNELPEELHPILRMPRIKVGTNELDVHIASQKNPIFLLDSQSNAARLFASSSDTSKMLEIQKRHKEKQAAANQEKKRLDAQSADLAAQLTKLEPLTALDAQLHTAEALYQEWLDTTQAIAKGAELQRQWQAADRVQEHCGAVAAALEALAKPPEFTPTEPCAALIAELLSVASLRAQAAAECAATAALSEPPHLPPTEPLAEFARTIVRFECEVAHASSEESSLRGLEAPPVLDNELTLRHLIDELYGTHAACQRIGAEHESLRMLRPVPEPESVATLQALAVALAHWQNEVTRRQHAHAALASLQPLPAADDPSRLVQTIDQLQTALEQCAIQQVTWQAVCAEYAAAGEELAAAAEESTCPTCGQAFDPQRLLDVTVSHGGHHHG
jgi:DNA repair ATPase RecN